MRIHPLQLTAHKGLRAEILLALKRAQPLTAKQLAHQLGVSVNAIRHHLKELEGEALIAYGREQRGVGAPTFAYRLSPDGEGLFPRAYEETLTQLLQRVADQGGRKAAVGLFEDHYRDLTRRLQAELAGAGTFRLSEHNCAIRAVAERFPEVCAAEERFLRDVLGAAVERRAHIASGCNACEYVITFTTAPPRESP